MEGVGGGSHEGMGTFFMGGGGRALIPQETI